MSLPQPTQRQLPPGVTSSLWEYVHASHIADDYDDFYAYNKLFDFDEQVLRRHFKKKGIVADLGCGSGRALVPLVRRGFSGLAVDLSEHMLRVVRQKAQEESLPITCLRANLVELDMLADESVDYAICLFSTLGMIYGRDNRQKILAHVHRILKPGGLFVVHAHNYWYHLFDRGGPQWMIANLLRSTVSRREKRGDKWFRYRGVPEMYLHVFTRGELLRVLRRAGLAIREVILLDATRHKELRWPWLMGGLRANGWIVVCEKR